MNFLCAGEVVFVLPFAGPAAACGVTTAACAPQALEVLPAAGPVLAIRQRRCAARRFGREPEPRLDENKTGPPATRRPRFGRWPGLRPIPTMGSSPAKGENEWSRSGAIVLKVFGRELMRRMSKKPRSETTEKRKRAGTREVRVARTRMGKGVFATRHYDYDSLIGEIQGEVIRDTNYSSEYCFNLGNDSCLEPTAPFRFVNHSCDPNCEFTWIDVVGRDNTTCRRLFLFALFDIKPGEELTIDYSWSAEAAIRCRCQAECCRGWIVDPSDLWKITGRLPDPDGVADAT
jgi:uncharacterized protein